MKIADSSSTSKSNSFSSNRRLDYVPPSDDPDSDSDSDSDDDGKKKKKKKKKDPNAPK